MPPKKAAKKSVSTKTASTKTASTKTPSKKTDSKTTPKTAAKKSVKTAAAKTAAKKSVKTAAAKPAAKKSVKTAAPKSATKAAPQKSAPPKSAPEAAPKTVAKTAPAAAAAAPVLPATGAAAPDFRLTTHDGKTLSLADFAGKIVVLYFYPKDDTPGCTTEACGFRDKWTELSAAGVAVLGVSPDDAASHAAFAAKFTLPFPLLVDADHTVAERYGAWGEKTGMYGKKSIGILRRTYLIDRAGKLAKIWAKVSVADHADEVLAAVRELGS